MYSTVSTFQQARLKPDSLRSVLRISVALVLTSIALFFFARGVLSDRTRVAADVAAAPVSTSAPASPIAAIAHTPATQEQAARAGINLRRAPEMVAVYDGDSQALLAGPAATRRPTALASADFDGDGFADLVVAYSTDSGGVISLHTANSDALAPRTPEATQAIAELNYPPPFVANARAVATTIAPDVVAVGDFDGDHRQDIIVAALGRSEINLLRGDGHGGFKPAESIAMPGRVTALLTDQVSFDGNTSALAVATDAGEGPKLLVFRGSGAAASDWKSEVFALPASASGLATGFLNGQASIMAAVGNELAIVNPGATNAETGETKQTAKKSVEAIKLGFTAQSVQTGHFIAGDHSLNIALLAANGTIHVMTQRDVDAPHRWVESEVRPGLGTSAGARIGGSQLLRVSLSAGATDDLLLVDRVNGTVQALPGLQYSARPATAGTIANSADMLTQPGPVAVPVEGAPIAAIPMKLNMGTRDGVVVLRKDSPQPQLLFAAAGTVINVTTTADEVNTNGQCSLREAIINANHNNQSGSTDCPAGSAPTQINLPAGTYTLTLSAGPYNAGAANQTKTFDDEFTFSSFIERGGDLDIANNDLTIVGAGSATTIVQAGTSAATNATTAAGGGNNNNIDRVFDINGDDSGTGNTNNLGHPINVTFSGMTIRNGKAPENLPNNNPANSPFFEAGGGIQFDADDQGGAPVSSAKTLTLTNTIVSDSMAAGQGGGIICFGSSSSAAQLVINGGGVNNNTSYHTKGGGLRYDGGTAASPARTLTISNATINGNSTLYHPLSNFGSNASFGGGINAVGGTGVTITNTTISGNHSDLLGAGLQIDNAPKVTVTGGSITNNIAKGDGGGIWSSARDVATNGKSTITIDGVTITGNQALGTASNPGNNGAGNGAGILNYFGDMTVTSTSATTHIDSNVAGGSGGGVYSTWSANSSDPSASFAMTGGTLQNNSAKANGGALAVQVSGATTFGTVNLQKVTITGNTANSDSAGGGEGGAIYNNGAPYTMNYSRVAANTANGAAASNEFRNVSGTATVTNNWWGTNSPSGVINGTATFTPWLQLSHTPATSPICPNIATTLTASFRNNSASTDVSANIDVLLGVPISFGNASLGTLSNGQTAIQSSPSAAKGTATATYTSGNTPGTGHADATVDTFAATANISVNQPPTFTSATSATFKVGSAGNFSVTTTATPAPTISKTAGSLPTGVTLTDNHDNTAALAGTPAAGTGGVYNLTFGATNPCGSDSQNFTLTVNEAPSITSANSTTFATGVAGSFTVTTGHHYPDAETIGTASTLPAGVTLADNGDGTATLSGTPAAGTGGLYSITIKASNGVSPDATQTFALTVNQPPAITSATGATFTVGTNGSFTVTKTGYPSPTLSKNGVLPGGVTFNASTGVLSGTAATGTGGSYPITFTAANGVGSDATQNFTLTVNEAPSITSANSTTFKTGTLGNFTVTTGHHFPTAESLSVAGSLPSGLTFTDNGDGTATLGGTPGGTTGGTYPLSIKATNGVTPDATQSFTLTVQQPPAITNGPPTTPTLVNSTYTFNYTATGFPAPTFTVASGSLPTGLTLSSSGAITGTPTAAGTYTGAIKASNGVSPDATQNFVIMVQASPAITNGPPPSSGVVGTAYNFTYTFTGYPAPTLTVTSGALPTGLSMTNGVISGVPTATGTFTGTVTAANGVSPNATQNFNITVNQTPAFTNGPPPSPATKSTSYSFTYTASGVPAPTFSVTSGALPTGLTLSSTGAISGSPSATGTFSGTVTATNVAGTATQNFTILVKGPPAFTNGPPPTSATKNSPYSFSYSASGVPSPTFSVTGGSLPAGLSLSSSGVISGTPTINGTSTGTVTATNGISPDATQAFSITVAEPPAFTNGPATSPATVNTSYSFTYTASGSPTPTFSVTSGSLPTGLSLSSAGAITGTPSTAGTFNGVVTATNSAGTATQNFNIIVNAANQVFYTVTSGSDNTDSTIHGGTGTAVDPYQMASVRGAVIYVDAHHTGADTILLPARTYTLSISGANETASPGDPTKGDLDIQYSGVTIQGSGAATTIINQTNGDSRVIDVNPMYAVGNFYFTLDGVTLSGGRETKGDAGGLYAGSNDTGLATRGKITVTNCIFTNNQVTGAGLGGGAFQHVGGDLVIANCTFGGNGATDPNTAGTAGGAVALIGYNGVAATFTVSSCTFTKNVANSSASGGGAIDLANVNAGSAAVTTISDCTFTGNNASVGSGGAIDNESQPGSTITRCTFLNNTADKDGGAVYGGSTTTTVQYSRLVGNTVTTPANGNVLARGSTSGSMTADDNWWGRPTGPTTNDTLNLTVTKWLTLTNTASPTTINTPNGPPAHATTLTASLLADSAGTAISPTNLTTLIGQPITWGTAVLGALSNTQTTIQPGGTATAILTAGSTGGNTGAANATVDSGAVSTSPKITINDPPAITSGATATFTVGTSGTFSATASGYPAATFTKSGSLPSGVSLSSAGALTGTPGAGTGGIYNLLITATNGITPDATQNFTLTVNQAPAITNGPPPSALTGSTYSFSYSSTGFPAPTYGLTAGSLPPGLALTSNGVLSGTPTTGGTYTGTVTATNSVGAAATQNFSITINDPPAFTNGPPPSSATINQPYNFTYTANGSPTFAVTSGSLPSGLSLNSTGVISGTPTALGTSTGVVTASNASGFATQAFSITVSPACANLVIVTNTNDSGSGSLRQALVDVCDAGTITFDPTVTGTIVLASPLSVNKNLTITGPGAGVIAVSGNNANSVVTVLGSGRTVNLSGMTFTAGNSGTGGAINNTFGNTMTLTNMVVTASASTSLSTGGGGIFNDGTLTVVTSTISNNTSTFDGGGIYNSANGKLTVSSSTVSGNSANDNGAGICTVSSTPISITGSTLSGNTATEQGGGLNGLANIANSTISTNHSTDTGGPGAGGGVFGGGSWMNVTIVNNTAGSSSGGVNQSGSLTMGNCIISGNTAPLNTDFAGNFTSAGHNLVQTRGTSTGYVASDLPDGTDPLLGALQNNGGPTATHLPAPNSPVINAGAGWTTLSAPISNVDTTVTVGDASVIAIGSTIRIEDEQMLVTNKATNSLTVTRGANATTALAHSSGVGVNGAFDQRVFARKIGTAVDIGAVEANYLIAATGGTPQSTAVNTAFGTDLQATVSESNFTLINGVSVIFTVTPAGNGASATFTTTNPATSGPNGVAKVTAQANSVVGGPYTVSAAATGFNGSATFSLTNTAGAATHFAVSAPSTATAGTQFNNLTVTALDGNGNVDTGYAGTVLFSSTDGAASLPASTTLTNGTGTFSATIKTAGNQTITATDSSNGSIVGTSNTIAVSAAAANHFSASAPSTATENAAFNFTITALDPFNNTATGYGGTVHFTSNDAAASLPGDTTLTNGAGTFNATLRTPGNRTITGTDTVTSSVTGTSNSISVSGAVVTHFGVVAPGSATAGTPFNFNVTALDAGNNTVTSYAGTVHFTSSDGAAVLPVNSGLTNGSGTFSANLKTAGGQTISVNDVSNPSITGTSNTVTVSAATATHFSVTAPSSASAASAFNFIVTALDQFNNVDVNFVAPVHFSSTDGAAALPGDYTFTNSDAGSHQFSATLNTAGNQTISAKDNNNASINGTSGNIAVGAGAATHFSIAAPANATAGTPFNFTITALDGSNNVTTGYTGTVHFTSSDGQAVLPGNYTFVAGDNGAKVLSATLKTSGNQTITGTDTGNATVSGTSGSIAVSALAANHFLVQAPASATAGTAFNFSVTAQDQFNNTDTSYAGTVHFTSTDGAGTLPADSTLISGTRSFPATLKTAGNQTITAKDTVTASIAGTSAVVTVSSANANHFSVSAPASATAGTPFNITITARDPFNNTVTSYTGTVHFTSSDGQAVLPGNYTFLPGDNGAKTLSATLKTAGAQTITGIDTANAAINGTSNSITVAGGAATHFTVTAPASATAGAPFNFTVTAFDAFNNVDTAYAGTVHLTSSDGQATLPADNTLVSGTGTRTFSATLKTAGAQTITAKDTANASIAGTSAAINVSPQAANHFVVNAPATAVLNGPFNFTVSALDQFNNAAPSYAGTVHFTSSDGAATLPPNSTLTNGAGTFSATMKTLGNQTITAIDTANASINGTSAAINVTKGGTNVSLSSSPNPSGSGQNVTFTATILVVPPAVGTPAGTVQFVVDGSNAGSPVPVSGSSAQYSTSTLSSGNHTVSGQYSGDSNFNGSTGSLSGGQNVNTATPTPTATATATPTSTPPTSPTPTATPTATPTSTPAQALNISTRVRVDVGDRVMIGGFIIRGIPSKPVVLRGLGPSLTNFGIAASDVLKDPVIELHGPNGSVITSNDNWNESPQKKQIEGTIFEPTDPHESVILATLDPGTYTIILSGVGNSSGIGIVEIYDNNQAISSDLANISTRGFVDINDRVMIGGFTLGGNNSGTRMAVRALGPSLSSSGLSNLLDDPTLELRNANGTVMISNDNWTDDATSAAELFARGLAPQNGKEAAIFTALAPPGQFTAIVAGKNGATGIALIEIYNLR